MKKIIMGVVVLMVIIIGLLGFRNYRTGRPDTVATEPDILSGFENLKIWGISPEEGFDLHLSRKHVTQGRYSLKVIYPKWNQPSINTKRLASEWGNYEEVLVDIFNPQKEEIDFKIRVDDVDRRRVVIGRKLMPGENKIRISRSELSGKIDAGRIFFVVFYIEEPQKRYTLYFDNLRLQRSDLITGIQNVVPDFQEKSVGGNVVSESASSRKTGSGGDLPFRKAQPVIPDSEPESGELRIAVAKLQEVSGTPVFISSGLPFAPGQLKDVNNFRLVDGHGQDVPIATKVLARWPSDGSIRSVLVQFHYPVEQLFSYVTLKWGEPRSIQDLKIVEPNWRFPQGIVVMPAEWMTRSRVIGWQVPMTHRDYDTLAASNFDALIQRPKTGNLRIDDYYSNAHTYYQLFVRGGELKYFIEARKELLNYRDNELVLEGKDRGRARVGREPRYVYMQAMLDDYLLTGDPRTLEVAGYMAEYLKNNFSPQKAFYPKGSNHFWTERVNAFPFLGLLTYYEMTGQEEYLRLSGQYMENLYKTQMQYPERGGFIHNLYAHDPEEGARPDEYGGSPFMTGLLLEAIVKYHQITGSEIAADSIFRAVDWIINEGIVPDGAAIKYMTADTYAGGGGHPDLNLLVVHAFGYAYYLSGYQNEDYLNMGEKLFEKGLKDGFLGQRKQFNQNYRSSGHYLAYIKGGIESKSRRLAARPESVSNRYPEGVLHFEGFEHSLGRFQSGPDTVLKIDSGNNYLNGNSLHVQSRQSFSTLSTGLKMNSWDLEAYGYVRFAYRINPTTPVGLRVQTIFGDWICLGGTQAYECGANLAQPQIALVDDGQWHEVSLRVDQGVQSVLPAIKRLAGFQFFTNRNAKDDAQFWIDDFKIMK